MATQTITEGFESITSNAMSWGAADPAGSLLDDSGTSGTNTNGWKAYAEDNVSGASAPTSSWVVAADTAKVHTGTYALHMTTSGGTDELGQFWVYKHFDVDPMAASSLSVSAQIAGKSSVNQTNTTRLRMYVFDGAVTPNVGSLSPVIDSNGTIGGASELGNGIVTQSYTAGTWSGFTNVSVSSITATQSRITVAFRLTDPSAAIIMEMAVDQLSISYDGLPVTRLLDGMVYVSYSNTSLMDAKLNAGNVDCFDGNTTVLGNAVTVDSSVAVSATNYAFQRGVLDLGRYWMIFYMDSTAWSSSRSSDAKTWDAAISLSTADSSAGNASASYVMNTFGGTYSAITNVNDIDVFEIVNSETARITRTSKTITGFSSNPAYLSIYRAGSYPWISFRNGSGPYSVKVLRSDNIYTVSGTWSQESTLKSTISSASIATRIIDFPAGTSNDIGCLYTDNTTLYFRYYTESSTTWETEQTVTSSLYSFVRWAGEADRDGVLHLIFSHTSGGVYYVARSAGSSGTWGTPVQIDASGTGISMAISHTDKTIYAFYNISNSIYYRTRNPESGTWSSSTFYAASSGAIGNGSIQCTSMAVNRILCAWTNNTGNSIECGHVINITPTQIDSRAINCYGSGMGATDDRSRSVQRFGTCLVATWIGRDWGIYVSSSKDGGSTWSVGHLLFYSSKDDTGHQWPSVFIDDNKYAYILALGMPSNTGGEVYFKMVKSSLPIDDISWTPDSFHNFKLWTNPRGGHKQILADQNGDLYVLYQTNDDDNFGIRRFDGTSWSAETVFATVPFADLPFLSDAIISDETTGQRSIHILWTNGYGDNASGYHYLKLTPQAEGYIGYDANGDTVTLPQADTSSGANKPSTIDPGDVRGSLALTSTQSVRILTGDTATENKTTKISFRKWNSNIGSITSISAANPAVVTSVGHGLSNGDRVTIYGSDSTPLINGDQIISNVTTDTFTVAVNVTVSGSAGTIRMWEVTNIVNGGTYGTPELYCDSNDNLHALFPEEDANGVRQLKEYFSDDDGDTWTLKGTITATNNNNIEPSMSSSGDLLWSLQLEGIYTEVLYQKLTLNLPVTNILDGKTLITYKTTNLLDGIFAIKNSFTNVFDGKTRIKNITTELLDGKFTIGNLTSMLLDGKTMIKDATNALLAAKVVLKNSSINLLDGIAKLELLSTALLDAKTIIKNNIASLCDGKISIKAKALNLLSGTINIVMESFWFKQKKTNTAWKNKNKTSTNWHKQNKAQQ